MYIITIRAQNDAIRETVIKYFRESGNTHNILVTNPFDLIDRINPNSDKYPVSGVAGQVIYFVPSKPELIIQCERYMGKNATHA